MKNEFKGTPGPWSVTDPCCLGVGGDFDKGWYKSVCIRPERTGGKLTDEYNANMRLIAAAPELLEALQFIIDDCSRMIPKCAEDKARTAIAKALGETK